MNASRSLPGRKEEVFEGMLEEADFVVERVPTELLHEEYRHGEYRVLHATKHG